MRRVTALAAAVAVVGTCAAFAPTPSGTSLSSGAPALAPAALTSADGRIARLLPGRMDSSRLGAGTDGSVLAVHVVDARSGAVVFSEYGNRPLRGASTMKVITAVAALRTLGREHRFPTPVRLLSTSADGAARIALVGGGDPLLTSAQLRGLATRTAAALRARGVTRATVVIDDSLFPPPTPALGWRSDYQPDVVRPVRALVRDSAAVMDSGADAGRHFAEQLDALVPTAYAGRATTSPTRPVLATTSGSTVEQAVRRMLLISENNVAEMLLRHAALASGRAPTWEGGSATAVEVLADLDIPLDGFVMRDGSGASRASRVTGRTLTTVLQRAVDTLHHRELWPIYAGRGMPTAGRTGSLDWRYRTAPSECAAGTVVAKTGALFDVLSLAGVTTGADGRPKAFAILLANPPTWRHDGRAIRVAIDGLAATITGCW